MAAESNVHQVQDVEDIPQDIGNAWDRGEDRIENGFDNAVNDVEDIPEDVAQAVGEVAGRFDRFGDNMDAAYDEGRQEGRDDDGGW